jgi:hypothetical protein
MQATNRIFAVLWIALVAALIGAIVWTPVALVPSVAKTELPAPTADTFTGEYERGIPVYRLPAMTVTTSRSVEDARIAREEQFARR